MHAFACLALMLAFLAQVVRGGPVLQGRQEIDIRDDDGVGAAGVPASNRTVFTMISLVCIGLLSFLLGKYTFWGLAVMLLGS